MNSSNYNYNLEHKELKLSKTLKALIIFFWLSNILGSTDFLNEYDKSLFPFLNELFTYRFPFGRGFLIVEWSIIFLSLYLIYSFQGHYKKNNFLKKLLLSAIPVFILILLNPNNTNNFSELFLAQDSKFILLYPLFFASLLFLENKILIIIIKQIFQVGIYILTVYALFSLIFYVTGLGPNLFGMRVTIPHSDILYYLGLIEIIFLIIFFVKHKYFYLIVSALLLIVLFLSMRRTETLVTVILNLAIVSYITLKSNKFNTRIVGIFSLFALPLLLIAISYFNFFDPADIISRQLSSLSFFDKSLNNYQVKDSGHIEQAVNVTISLTENIKFWGGGIQKQPFYLYGQSSRAHSNLAYSMAKYGLYVSIYYLILFLVFLMMYIKFIISYQIHDKWKPYYLVKFSALTLLVSFFISGWISGNNLFDIFPQTYIQFILLLSVVKLEPNEVNYIFRYNV